VYNAAPGFDISSGRSNVEKQFVYQINGRRALFSQSHRLNKYTQGIYIMNSKDHEKNGAKLILNTSNK
jgi:hypothetical protein